MQCRIKQIEGERRGLEVEISNLQLTIRQIKSGLFDNPSNDKKNVSFETNNYAKKPTSETASLR